LFALFLNKMNLLFFNQVSTANQSLRYILTLWFNFLRASLGIFIEGSPGILTADDVGACDSA